MVATNLSEEDHVTLSKRVENALVFIAIAGGIFITYKQIGAIIVSILSSPSTDLLVEVSGSKEGADELKEQRLDIATIAKLQVEKPTDELEMSEVKRFI